MVAIGPWATYGASDDDRRSRPAPHPTSPRGEAGVGCTAAVMRSARAQRLKSGLRHQGARDGPAVAAELRDGFAGLRTHRHIVDAAALAPVALSRLSEQAHPEAPRSQVGDLAVLRNV